jgi:hypothetical protein
MTVGNISPVDSSFSEIPKKGTKPAAAGFSEVLAQHLPQAVPFDDVFLDAGSKYNVSPALLKAVASAESDFNPDEISSAGAVGLMQIMPDTAQQLGIDPRDPVQSIHGAANYLRTLLDQFNGNVTLAIAAYNAGPGAVSKYGGIPPYKETQDYVVHVADLMKKYSSNSTGPESGGVNSVPESTGSRVPSGRDATALADLLLIWTEAERRNALSKLDSDDASGVAPTEAEDVL